MIRVHLLTEPPKNQNTAAFLSPLVWNAPLLRARNIDVRLFYQARSGLADCDVVAVNSKIWPGDWAPQKSGALALLEGLRRRGRVVYFDRSSTPGLVNADVLPYVDSYLKNAAYRDRSLYQRSVYGARLFAEYYRDRDGVIDSESPYTPQPLSAEDSARIAIAWNTGLASYTLLGPRAAAFYRRIPARHLFSPPRRFTSPATPRPIQVSCRMSVNYRYATVGQQRRRLAELLAQHRRTQRVSKIAYVRELRRSRISASPFGYSEINYKDFESFLSGATLLKPDMSHLETWPDYYRANDTYIPHRWDLGDVTEKIEATLAQPERAEAIARAGQEAYRWHVADPAGQLAFAERFARIIGAP